MKKKYYLLAALLGLLTAVAVPQGKEMEELSLIATLAADRTEDGVTVTALTGVRANEDETPETLTGTGQDMAAACQAVQESRASHAYLGQTDKLLLGEELARTGLMEVLEFVLDHGELRLDTLLYMVEGNAGEGLAATAPAMAGETPGRDQQGVTVGRVLSRLYEGRRIEVPVLAPGQDGLLERSGRVILDAMGVVGRGEDERVAGGPCWDGRDGADV